jgi:hypothetical protein
MQNKGNNLSDFGGFYGGGGIYSPEAISNSPTEKQLPISVPSQNFILLLLMAHRYE